ncbi:hypothetical protein [Richelia sinica]|uniref:hypothetical protein n=1 Tax=Richelia sinica TaxID=1357545 RepID=UPI001687AD2A|nr:hypothetical protein [Richelia sinica]MBD2666199.1 hypothetical protein [Richelia sinica FACHB-800]
MINQQNLFQTTLRKFTISLLLCLPIITANAQKSLAIPLGPIIRQAGYQAIEDLLSKQSSDQSSSLTNQQFTGSAQDLAGTIGATSTTTSDSSYPSSPPGIYQEGSPGSQPSYQQGYLGYSQPNYQQGYPGYSQPSYQQGYPGYSQPSYQQGYPGYSQPSYQQGYPGYSQPNYQQGYPSYPVSPYPMMYPFYPPMRTSPPVIINNF